MAAVLSEIVTDTPYFPKMRRADERQRSPPRQRHNSNPRVPESPRFKATDDLPQRQGAEQNAAKTQPSGAGSYDDPRIRQPFASQQNFPSHNDQQPAQNEQAGHNYYPPQNTVPPLASPADSASSPIPRSVWSSENIHRYDGGTIKVRDLAHIQSFATEDFLSYRGSLGTRGGRDTVPKYEISGMPITDVIEMVAGLLTKITTTNDRQHEHLHRPLPISDQSNMLPLTSSVLAFHGKNVPSITILSYLSRIHKYCPTTYEVFLSLLVYFDRMTERVNAPPMQQMKSRASSERTPSRPSTGATSGGRADEDMEMPRTPMSAISNQSSTDDLHGRGHYATPPDDDQIAYNLSHFFVVDSFNIHRLVIAGVTCASKFFSDVFYTNSRYAKVIPTPGALFHMTDILFRLVDYH
jgi:hypothetical protein